jgi:SpoVK/Ycf46/Vps4 family AAA+-type ATPase
LEQQLVEAKHLRSEIRELLSKPIEERIRALEEDIYIPYNIGNACLEQMERLFKRERTGRPLGMLIASASGNGKTTILRTFGKKHPSIPTTEVDLKPVITLQAPPSPSEKRFLGQIIRAFDLLDYDKGPAETRLKRVSYLVDKCEVKVLLIDEIHNLLSGSSRQLEETCNLVKYLANELGVSIVLAGTERAENVIASDPQLVSRFPIVNLPPWNDGQSFREFLTLLEATIPLAKPSNLASAPVRRF